VSFTEDLFERMDAKRTLMEQIAEVRRGFVRRRYA
jgi:hypothetical protein